MAVTVGEFSKIFRGSMPPDPLEPFFVRQLASNQFFRKELDLKNIEIWCHFFKKISDYTSDIKHF